MEEKLISLLKKQIEKLSEEDFDLEAWKASAVALLARIYGEKDLKVEKISKLQIDYSSWALRDAKSNYNPLESCRKQGRELLLLSIDELENFGLPKQNESSATLFKVLESELKGSQMKELKEVLCKESDKEKAVKKLVKSWGATVNTSIVSDLILSLSS